MTSLSLKSITTRRGDTYLGTFILLTSWRESKPEYKCFYYITHAHAHVEREEGERLSHFNLKCQCEWIAKMYVRVHTKNSE